MTHTGRAFPHPVYEQYVLQPFFRDALTYYYQPILATNKAHAVMLYRSGIIDHAIRALLDALHAIETDEQGATAYQSGVEDLFFVIENGLSKRLSRPTATTCS